MIVAFLGADGSGKSTVIDKFLAHVADDWAEVKYVHFRPTYFLRRKENRETVSNPHEGKSRGSFMSLLKLLLFVLEYNWAFYIHSKKFNQLIIFDRYYYDVLADPQRVKICSPLWLVKCIARLIRSDLVLYLNAPVETLYSRKREVGKEALTEITNRYLALVKHYSFYTVSSDTSLEATMNAVISIYEVHRDRLKGQL